MSRDISAVNEITMHLRCDPAGGNVASPAASCTTLRARRGELLPPSNDELCIGGMFFVDVAVEGTVDGKHVERD
jgi:hypothetical protein